MSRSKLPGGATTPTTRSTSICAIMTGAITLVSATLRGRRNDCSFRPDVADDATWRSTASRPILSPATLSGRPKCICATCRPARTTFAAAADGIPPGSEPSPGGNHPLLGGRSLWRSSPRPGRADTNGGEDYYVRDLQSGGCGSFLGWLRRHVARLRPHPDGRHGCSPRPTPTRARRHHALGDVFMRRLAAADTLTIAGWRATTTYRSQSGPAVPARHHHAARRHRDVRPTVMAATAAIAPTAPGRPLWM